jgi:hypothetical protein
LALISTVWIVPFLMFLEVTTMVAAVAAVLAITAETNAAISALFMCSPFLGLRLWPQRVGSMRDPVPSDGAGGEPNAAALAAPPAPSSL